MDVVLVTIYVQLASLVPHPCIKVIKSKKQEITWSLDKEPLSGR